MEAMKRTARIAGALYLLQIPLGIFGIVYVPKTLYVTGNLSATTVNILANACLFRLSSLSALLCALVTVATAYWIHKVLKPVNKGYARAILLFTLLVAPITFINELNHLAVLLLLEHPELTNTFAPEQIQSLVGFFLQLHQGGLQLAGVFFGLWLLPMGYLVIKSTYIPKTIGYFLILTCVGYLADVCLYFLFPQSKLVISEFTWPGEVMMVLWLLTKGVRAEAYGAYVSEQEAKLAQ